MDSFSFVNLSDCPEEDLFLLSDLYFEAKIIDSPQNYCRNLPLSEQKEILSLYRSGKYLKVIQQGKTVGFIGHGVRSNTDTIMIFYIFTPEHRGKGLFKPVMDHFCDWCRKKYPDKKFLRANTEATNLASISSLKKAGFEFFEEKLDGPSDDKKVLFQCFVRQLA